ncbi:hypothetical protein BSKO_06653 [Bryopsis sp. KO-2023]|nr:hypothetical protein BSKO_06653 [Bryopsis sp. KO-2023]
MPQYCAEFPSQAEELRRFAYSQHLALFERVALTEQAFKWLKEAWPEIELALDQIAAASTSDTIITEKMSRVSEQIRDMMCGSGRQKVLHDGSRCSVAPRDERIDPSRHIRILDRMKPMLDDFMQWLDEHGELETRNHKGAIRMCVHRMLSKEGGSSRQAREWAALLLGADAEVGRVCMHAFEAVFDCLQLGSRIMSKCNIEISKLGQKVKATEHNHKYTVVASFLIQVVRRDEKSRTQNGQLSQFLLDVKELRCRPSRCLAVWESCYIASLGGLMSAIKLNDEALSSENMQRMSQVLAIDGMERQVIHALLGMIRADSKSGSALHRGQCRPGYVHNIATKCPLYIRPLFEWGVNFKAAFAAHCDGLYKSIQINIGVFGSGFFSFIRLVIEIPFVGVSQLVENAGDASGALPWPEWCVDIVLFTLQRDASVRIRRAAIGLVPSMSLVGEKDSSLCEEITTLLLFKIRDRLCELAHRDVEVRRAAFSTLLECSVFVDLALKSYTPQDFLTVLITGLEITEGETDSFSTLAHLLGRYITTPAERPWNRLAELRQSQDDFWKLDPAVLVRLVACALEDNCIYDKVIEGL